MNPKRIPLTLEQIAQNQHQFMIALAILLGGVAIIALVVWIWRRVRQIRRDEYLTSVWYKPTEIVRERAEEAKIQIYVGGTNIPWDFWKKFSPQALGGFIGSLLYTLFISEGESGAEKTFRSLVDEAFNGYRNRTRSRKAFFRALVERHRNSKVEQCLADAIEFHERDARAEEVKADEGKRLEKSRKAVGIDADCPKKPWE